MENVEKEERRTDGREDRQTDEILVFTKDIAPGYYIVAGCGYCNETIKAQCRFDREIQKVSPTQVLCLSFSPMLSGLLYIFSS